MSTGDEQCVVGLPLRHSRLRIVWLAGLVVIALFGVTMIWLTIGIHRAQRQRETIAEITHAGGHIYYAYQWDFDHFCYHLRTNAEPQPWVPELLRRILGDDFFYDVVDVSLKDGDDAAIAKLRIWKNLKGLNINRCTITDRGMEYVGEFSNLEVLWLGGSPEITSAGFCHLKRLSRLRELNIDQCPISDSDLVNLSVATELRNLTLMHTHVNGSGLAYLKPRNLTDLTLDSSPVTDDGLSGIKSLPNITCFCLNRTLVSDKGMVWLKNLNLNHLELDGTRVTGTGLRYLRGSKDLEELCLVDAPVTDEGLAVIGGFSRLKNLYLSSNTFTDAGLPSLGRLAQAEILSMKNDNLSISAVKDLERRLGQNNCVWWDSKFKSSSKNSKKISRSDKSQNIVQPKQ